MRTFARRHFETARSDCASCSGNKTIRYVEHFDSDGELMYEHACSMGLEGIVSKRRDLAYRSGLSKTWLKIKNPNAAAALRLVQDFDLG